MFRKEVSWVQNLIAVFAAFWDKYMFWINRPDVTVTDIVEILIIAFLLYHTWYGLRQPEHGHCSRESL